MITKVIGDESIQQVKEIIAGNERFVIVAHISPDGDAVGSTQGMAQFLGEWGKEATVVYNDSVSDNLKWIPGVKGSLIYEETPEEALEAIEQADVIFCMDFNIHKRMGKIADAVVQSRALRVMIDHHLCPGDFCDVVISHPEISSTSELLYRLIRQMGETKRIDERGATAIYTGMMTDTGAFTYNSSNPQIYMIIAELLKKGIDKDKIYDRVFNTFTENRERLMGYTINKKMRLFKEYNAAMISLTSEELKSFDYKKGDSEGFVNIPLSVKGVVFSAFFRQDEEYVKVSLRSKGNFPANKVSEQYFNGGGHKNAAGGEFFGTIEEAERLFEEILPLFSKYLED
ncbi:MAG: bifunctional oligoribonuclease/PAP phosphatase NrnA [Bacteroidales bacterium]